MQLIYMLQLTTWGDFEKNVSIHSYFRWKDFKSLAQVWLCSRQIAMLEVLMLKMFKYGKIEESTSSRG
jgi:hypothetical protein